MPYIVVRVREAKLDRYTEEGTHIVARIMQVNRKNTRLYNKTIAVVECMGSDRNEYSQKVLLDIGDEYVVGDDIDVYVSANNPKNISSTPKDIWKNKAQDIPTIHKIRQTIDMQINIEQLEKLSNDEYVLFDMRPEADRAYGFIPDSVSVTEEELRENPPADKSKKSSCIVRREF